MEDYLYLANEFPNVFKYKTNEDGKKELTVNDVRKNMKYIEKVI